MFSTPQKRGGSSPSFGTPTIKVPLAKGLFSDGVWHCNCVPRLPATRFKVKKEGFNKGRWFYTCQVPKDAGGCRFFLWDEAAKNREGQALMGNNSTSEKPLQDSGTLAGDSMVATGGGTPTSAMRGNSVTVKVERSETDDDTEFGSWPLTPTTEMNLVENTVMSPETPKKTPKLSAFTTPGSKRKRDYESESDESKIDMGGLPTPFTGESFGRRRPISLSEYGNDDEDIFSTPSSLRTPSHQNSFGIRSPSNTPVPSSSSRFRQSSPTPLSSRQERSASANPYDITAEVLNLLQGDNVQLDDETKGKLKGLLRRHGMKVSGVAKGRDITRVALKSRDAKIAELVLRVGQLEMEREVDKQIISGLRVERQGEDLM